MESLLQLKQALDAGLISSSDFDAGKSAFLRAQQMRSGFEAGLLSASDYALVKETFLRRAAPIGSALGGAAIAQPAAWAGSRRAAPRAPQPPRHRPPLSASWPRRDPRR